MPNSFDPSKSYKWEPTDIFEFTGQQLAHLYHALKQEMENPGGAPLYLKVEAYNAMMDIFNRGVEQGIIYEVNPQVVDVDTDRKVKVLFNTNHQK